MANLEFKKIFDTGADNILKLDTTLSQKGKAADAKATGDAISEHNTSVLSHNDIRIALQDLIDQVTSLLNTDDQTLDETREIVAYIKANRTLIDNVTIEKVDVSDIVNNLVSNVTDRPLSAAQGVVLKSLIASNTAALADKLSNSQLTSAINTALAQAKASGEFKGDKPVKGTDYWTEADQESIVQDVIAALGTPVFGTVDENCHINLTGKLADGKTYTFTYEDENGVVSTIGTYTKAAAPTYTNLIPLSINADGSQYIGNNGEDGYNSNIRVNSSGGETSATGYYSTGYIPALKNDTLYFANMSMLYDATDGNSKIALFDENFTHLNFVHLRALYENRENEYVAPFGISYADDTNLEMLNLGVLGYWLGSDILKKIRYIRIVCKGINEDSVITKNEPIE